MAPMLLIPVWQPALRRIAVLLMILFHLSIQFTLAIGTFQLVMIALCSLLISREDWKIISRFGSYAAQWKIIKIIVNFLKAIWVKISVPLIRSGVQKEKVRSGSMLFLSSTINCLMVLAILSGFLENYYVNINPLLAEEGTAKINRDKIPEALKVVSEFPHFRQDWNMFAPNAPESHGWLVIDGETASGAYLDPLTGRAPTIEEPSNLYLHYDKFWRKYFSNLCKERYSSFRPFFAQYLIRKNQRDTNRPGDRFVSLKFYYISLETRLPGDFQSVEPKEVLLLKYE
jgi:hypothetical protein